MKFKPVALVVIGVLLGSTVTLAITRPSASTAEVLACTNKKSGKTRLTISGKCNIESESQSPVTDLWSLQPTGSTSTQPKALKKHVVDSNGKDLGELLSQDFATNSYWVQNSNGLFNIYADGRVFANLSSWDPAIFEDSKCQLPLLGGMTDGIDLATARAIVEIPSLGAPSNKTLRMAFRPIGKSIPTPAEVFFYVSPATIQANESWFENTGRRTNEWMTKAGCIKVNSSDIDTETRTKTLLRSSKVNIPVFTPSLKIIEK
jgi:hypothetical protein